MNKIEILSYIFMRLGDINLSEEREAQLSAIADQITIQQAEEILGSE